MKYPLDCEPSFAESLLFWLCKFVKFKLNSLSNKELKSPQDLAQINFALSKGVRHIDELDALAKKARNVGLIGVNTYFNPLKKLYEYLILYKPYSLTQIDEELLTEILASITASLSDASKKNYRIAILNFFDFLDKQNEEDGRAHVFGITLKNWSGIVGGKGTKLPEFMSEDEVMKFLEAVENADFKANTTRNKLIIKIIIFTGIRVSEAIHIKMGDISEENDLFVIRIRAKGNKYRVVMIKKHLIAPLIDDLAINYLNKDHYLFVNRLGEPLTQAYVSRIVEQILFGAGIRKKKNGAHMLRHTFATLLYKKQKDLVLVQEALGHASLNTSRIYTHFDSEKLKLAAEVAEDLSENSAVGGNSGVNLGEENGAEAGNSGTENGALGVNSSVNLSAENAAEFSSVKNAENSMEISAVGGNSSVNLALENSALKENLGENLGEKNLVLQENLGENLGAGNSSENSLFSSDDLNSSVNLNENSSKNSALNGNLNENLSTNSSVNLQPTKLRESLFEDL